MEHFSENSKGYILDYDTLYYTLNHKPLTEDFSENSKRWPGSYWLPSGSVSCLPLVAGQELGLKGESMEFLRLI